MDSFEAVIGLEVHAQLATESKIFATSACNSESEPNSNTDPVTLGLPGCLPVLNKRAVDYAIKLGIATKSEIARESSFSRKHYFYPDLPKGYQISQYDQPICIGGEIQINVNGEKRSIPLTRIHLEEDAGKSTHSDTEAVSLVDLNRAGVPLVEIVSEPEIRTAQEATAYVRQIRQLVRYLDICDGNMESGNMRCDANISIRKIGESELGTKVEIKNLNSFRFIERAIEHEIERQIAVYSQGGEITQETRLWDEQKGNTRVMRTKEAADDYRYFPDPDLLPLIVDEDWIEKIKAGLPELPQDVFERFKSIYALDDQQCGRLTEEKLTASYYDRAVNTHNNPSAIANWITTELFGRLNKEGLEMEDCPVSPENLSHLVKLIDDSVISGKIAKSVFDEMFSTGASPENIVKERGLEQVSNEGLLTKIIDEVLSSNPDQVAQFREGKTKMMGFFVGQIMKQTQGKANPKLVNELLQKKLS